MSTNFTDNVSAKVGPSNLTFGNLIPVNSIVTSIPCEGSCCCECQGCSGKGYWSSYDVTIPANNFTVTWSGESFLNSSQSFSGIGVSKLPNTGICTFGTTPKCFTLSLSGTMCLAGGTVVFGIDQYGYAIVGVTYQVNTGSYSWSFNCNWISAVGFNCLSPSAIPFDHQSYSQYPTGTTVFTPWYPRAIPLDMSGTTVTVAPSSGATWTQCGSSSSGAPMFANPFATKSVNPLAAGAKIPLLVTRPTKCECLEKRTEFRSGCNGWKCRHECKKGLPAVPGEFCQMDCREYVPDQSYEQLGVAGWLQ